ncbi:MAG: hypothetical protein KGS48_07480 [Bacteroidetes bacterium]|nr:hypothetical protein [Bacteroidota bacterium]
MEPNFRDLDSEKRLSALEKAFAASEHRAQKLAEANHALQQELHQLQHDYQALRLQKGGFGFKSLLASGLLATLVSVIMMYFFFRHSKDLHAQQFRRFVKENQFNIEYAIGQGQFLHAEELLKKQLEAPENAVIQPEIELVYKIVGATKRRCAQN